jgi:hypothetical protein
MARVLGERPENAMNAVFARQSFRSAIKQCDPDLNGNGNGNHERTLTLLQQRGKKVARRSAGLKVGYAVKITGHWWRVVKAFQQFIWCARRSVPPARGAAIIIKQKFYRSEVEDHRIGPRSFIKTVRQVSQAGKC